MTTTATRPERPALTSPPPALRPERSPRRIALSQTLSRWDVKVSPYLYISPFFILFAIVGLFPLLYTSWVSVHEWNLIGGQGDFGNGLQQHASPSSDGWNASSNASPEPYIASTASTPPSGDGQPVTTGRQLGQRKYVPLKQNAQRKKSLPTLQSPNGEERRSTASTPELGGEGGIGSGQQGGKGGSEDGEAPPILCTNCQTTNTPL